MNLKITPRTLLFISLIFFVLALVYFFSGSINPDKPEFKNIGTNINGVNLPSYKYKNTTVQLVFGDITASVPNTTGYVDAKAISWSTKSGPQLPFKNSVDKFMALKICPELLPLIQQKSSKYWYSNEVQNLCPSYSKARNALVNLHKKEEMWVNNISNTNLSISEKNDLKLIEPREIFLLAGIEVNTQSENELDKVVYFLINDFCKKSASFDSVALTFIASNNVAKYSFDRAAKNILSAINDAISSNQNVPSEIKVIIYPGKEYFNNESLKSEDETNLKGKVKGFSKIMNEDAFLATNSLINAEVWKEYTQANKSNWQNKQYALLFGLFAIIFLVIALLRIMKSKRESTFSEKNDPPPIQDEKLKSNEIEIYDIGLSFAGENREYVFQVAEILKENQVKVFYDNYESEDLWGKNLYQHLNDIYKNKCRFCVIFISKAYADKAWTNHELKSAQARAFNENKEYILPARFDNTEIPGIDETIAYKDCNEITPKELALMIIEKLRLN